MAAARHGKPIVMETGVKPPGPQHEKISRSRIRVADADLHSGLRRADGSLVATGACCKQGIDIAYDGTWGYHPLIVSLANTAEVLSIVNRPGNRPSHEGAAEQLDLAILLCRQVGFRKIYLRGDTDFTQTKQIDAWDAEGVTFLFGIDAMVNLKAIAEDLPATEWAELQRSPRFIGASILRR